MRLLLDTHLLLWAAGTPKRLSALTRKAIASPDNNLFFSVASIWEIVIKRGLDRSDFQVDAHLLRRGLLDNGYVELAITGPFVVQPALSQQMARFEATCSRRCRGAPRADSTDIAGSGRAARNSRLRCARQRARLEHADAPSVAPVFLVRSHGPAVNDARRI
ncbi:hypothetical protein J7E62_22410 [Variovorax paradoxus]|nr:hypothetical protein [Variovorax paradoxus]